MLTQVLLTYMLRTAAVMVPAAALLGLLLGGPEIALAVGLGGAVVGGSGAVQIWLVGMLLDPTQGTPQKVVAGTMLLFKLVFVLGVLWWVMNAAGPDALGLAAGMATGLAALVIGVHHPPQDAEHEHQLEKKHGAGHHLLRGA
ncbi:MAG: hypothetical protein AAFZ18_07010, partial [Myxococcota bacterium]